MRDLNYRYRAITETAGQFSTAIASVAMAYNGFGVWTLVFSVLFGQSVVVLAYLPLLKHVPAFSLDYRKIKGIVAYGSHLMFSQILEFFTLKADIFIISLFLPHKIVGFYSMGLQLATMPMDKIGTVFNKVGFPAISRVKNNRSESRTMFIYMHRYLIALTYPMLVGFMLIAEDLVVLVLTEKWLPIVIVIQVLCVINLMRVSGMIMPYVLAGLGQSGRVLGFQLMSSILLPLAFLVGVQYGMYGVLAGWFVAYPVLYAYIVVILARSLDISVGEYFSTFRSPLVCTGIMFVAVYLVKTFLITEVSVSGMFVSIALGAIAYMSAYYLLFRDEWSLVAGKIRSLRR